jgi:hypothetical protein
VWIITGWQCISPEVTVKSFKYCIAIAVDETGIGCGMTVKRMGM